MASPPLSNIIDFGYRIRNIIASDEIVAKLLTNSVVPVEPDDLIDKYIFDYDYVDDVTRKSGCYVMIDVNGYTNKNSTMMGVTISVFIMCHKPNMRIQPDILPGFKGSRRDNLAIRIDEILRKTDWQQSQFNLFGLSSLVLTDYDTTSAPDEYTCKVLIYDSADFLRKPK